MSPDLSTRVRSYAEELERDVAHVTVTEIEQRLADAAPKPVAVRLRTRRRIPGWAAAVVAAFLVLTAIGGAALVFGGDAADVVDEPASTMAPPPSSSPLSTGWTPVGPEAFSGAVPEELPSVLEADGLLMASGCVETVTSCRASVWTSTDGEAWAEVPDAATGFPADSWGVMAKGDPGFVMVGSTCSDEDGCQTLVWSSPDGVRWTQGESAPLPTCASPCELGVEEVVAARFGFVARGLLGQIDPFVDDGFLLFSEDGLDWSVSQRVTGDHFDSLLRVGDSVVAFGRGDVWTTTDGLIWVTTAHAEDGPLGGFPPPGGCPEGCSPPHSFEDVLLFDDRIVAVGRTDLGDGARPAAWYSENGVAWQEATLVASDVDEGVEEQSLAVAAVFDGSLVALSHPDSDGRVTIWTSPDGAVWTEDPGAGPQLGGYTCCPPELVATSEGLLAVGYGRWETVLWIWRPPDI